MSRSSRDEFTDVQEHILGIFESRYGTTHAKQKFVSEVDNLKRQNHCSTQQAVRKMCDGGRFLVSTDSIKEFLREIGAIDGRIRNPEKIWDTYRTVVARNGSKLYDSLKTETNSHAILESPRTSYNKKVIEAVQQHILNEFGDDAYGDDGLTPEERFVDQINQMIGGQNRTVQDAMKQWIEGASPEIYDVDRVRFLKSIGIDDGKTHESYESSKLYERILLRDGMKLYEQIVSGKRKPKKPSVSVESPKYFPAFADRKTKGKPSRPKTTKITEIGTPVSGNGELTIQAIYYDPTESEKYGRNVFDVVLGSKGSKFKAWVKDYNPKTGGYRRVYPEQTSADIRTHAKGHVKVGSFAAPSNKNGRFRGVN